MSNSAEPPMIDIIELASLQEPPPLFTPGEQHFWTDAHIARQMLSAHLDASHDAASRRPETIQRSVEWIVKITGLSPGDHVLDLGCGPGLYATRLAKFGLHVTGIDFSPLSIEYAEAYSKKHGLAINYHCMDYMNLSDSSIYDTVLLIYGDYCTFSPNQRAHLLANVRQALKPGGKFVLDVSTPALRQREGLHNSWYASPAGFWKPGPHLVLQQGFSYSENIYLDQYIVIESNGRISIYRNWFQDFTADTIQAELEAHGYLIESLWGDLTGAPFTSHGDWIGVVARVSD